MDRGVDGFPPERVWFIPIRVDFAFDLWFVFNFKTMQIAKIRNWLNFLKPPLLDSEASSALQVAHASDDKSVLSFLLGSVRHWCFRLHLMAAFATTMLLKMVLYILYMLRHGKMYLFPCVEFFMPWFTWRPQCTWLCKDWLHSKSELAKWVAIVDSSIKYTATRSLHCWDQLSPDYPRDSAKGRHDSPSNEVRWITKSSSKVVFLSMAVWRQKWPFFIFPKYYKVILS